jgi:hypothetical protein
MAGGSIKQYFTSWCAAAPRALRALSLLHALQQGVVAARTQAAAGAARPQARRGAC